MKAGLISLLLIFLALHAVAQKEMPTLHIEQVFQIVRQYHPVVKQANIHIEKANADLTVSRGTFNPILSNYLAHKTFDQTAYYEYWNPNITIPTWYGIDISIGLENLMGNRFDPSESEGQSSYIGVQVPLLKNLILDKRRAYLKQSKLYTDMAYTERQATINTIFKDAAVQYWEWVFAHHAYEIVQKNAQVSQLRFELVKKAFINGERPAIDTLEALTQFQNFEFQKNESKLQVQTERLLLNVFLWQADNVPYQLPEDIVPQKGWDDDAYIQDINLNESEILATAQQYHPELRLYDQKLSVFTVEKKLKFQELLPKLDFRYNHLNKGYRIFNSEGLLFQNNFQYGLKFEMPLLFSQGRGEYRKAKLILEETRIQKGQKALQITLQVRNLYNQWLNVRNQVRLQRDLLANYEKLLQAEETIFQNGESSLFVINARENKVLETELKLIELKTKYYKTTYSLQWSAGMLR